MKSLLIGLAILSSVPSFAGDSYMNCGEGKSSEMEEFIASSLVVDGKSHVVFKKDNFSYSVKYQNNVYQITSSNQNVGGFTTFEYIASGYFKDSGIFNGLSCKSSDLI